MNLVSRLKAAASVLVRGISPQQFLRGDDMVGAMNGMAEPYRQSAWVQSAIKKVAGPIASVGVEFYQPVAAAGDGRTPGKRRRITGRGIRRMDDEQMIEVPELREFLRRPMAGYGYASLVESTIGWLKLRGEAFWILPDETLLPFRDASLPLQVIVARPDRMQHVVEGGKLVGWRFTDAFGHPHALLPEQVIHEKLWNPYDDFRGLGEYEAAKLASDADFLSAKFKKNLMANNGDTGPILVAKGGIPTPEQQAQIMEQLRAKRRAQQRGEFTGIFLSGDIAVEDPKIQTVDASYILGRTEDRHEIYIAFGVPPSLADVKAAYSIGSASDLFQLVSHTCLPAGDRFCDMLQRLAVLAFKRDLEVYLNWDENHTMQEVRRERLASIDVLWTKGMPLSEISEYLDLGLPEFDGWDTGYLPFSVVPADAAGLPDKDPTLGEDEEPTPPVDEEERGLCGCGCGRDGGYDLVTRAKDRDPKEVAQWREHMAKRRKTIRAYETRVTRELTKARAEVLRKIGAESDGRMAMLRAIGQRAAAADLMFSLADFTKGLQTALRSVAMDALQTAGEQLYAEIAKDDPWSMPPAKAQQFLKERDNRIAGASKEVFDNVMESLQEGLDQGDTTKELADRVRSEFNNMNKTRATRIAMTETSAAYGVARQEAMQSAGLKFKRWLTSGNANVRAAHRMANGATVPIGEKFTVIDPKTGQVDQVSHPGDPEGAPWNVINCHCVAIGQVEEAPE
jgi:SPP1 gp7 family putative phage head morphogenesis protein